MSDFLKRFLLEDSRKLSATGRYVALAAFGKHPGWDDHIEPRDAQEAKGLGLETESLNIAKTTLYVKGIGGQIDSGAWEKLEEGQQLSGFKHVFIWQRSGQILVGRLWSSSDGKGRTRFPMVVCLHFIGVTLGWALKQALPLLEDLEHGCVTTTSAAEVCSLLSRKRAAIREAVQAVDGGSEYAPLTPSALQKILEPNEAKSEGFLRVLYQIQSQLSIFLSGKSKTGTSIGTLRAQQIRVPVTGQSPEEAFLFWTRFFLAQMDSSAPLLMTLALEESWMDVTVSEPQSHEFFCLRASPRAVPMVSEVPYNLDDGFRAKGMAFLDDLRRGEMASNRKPTSTTPLSGNASEKSGWRKWLGVGVIAVMASAAAFFLMSKKTLQNANSSAPIAPPHSSNAVAAAGVGTVPSMDSRRVNAQPAASVSIPPQPAEIVSPRETAVRTNPLRAAPPIAVHPRNEPQQFVAAIKTNDAAKPGKEPDQPAGPAPIPRPKPHAVVNAPPPQAAEMTNSIGMVLVRMPSGFWAGKYEVTHGEYRKVMGTNTSAPVNERRPAERVGWSDAKAFCDRLTEIERGQLSANQYYSLPTTKQWDELAGGQKFEDLPNRGVTGKWFPSAVGESAPANKNGLFDVIGNVWEWCLDGTDRERFLRGGGVNSTNYERLWIPGKPVSNCGFRCVLSAP